MLIFSCHMRNCDILPCDKLHLFLGLDRGLKSILAEIYFWLSQYKYSQVRGIVLQQIISKSRFRVIYTIHANTCIEKVLNWIVHDSFRWNISIWTASLFSFENTICGIWYAGFFLNISLGIPFCLFVWINSLILTI